MKQAAIFCEGYQDRAFISAWLEARGAVRAPINRKDVYTKRIGNSLEVRIVPMKGGSDVARFIGDYLLEDTHYDRIVVVIDSDELTPEERTRRTVESLGSTIPGSTPYEIACWSPRLESHIERALRHVWPDRTEAIDRFLTSRPEPPPTKGKEVSFSYCAGWEPDAFGDTFYGWVLASTALRPVIEGDVLAFSNAIDHVLALASV